MRGMRIHILCGRGGGVGIADVIPVGGMRSGGIRRKNLMEKSMGKGGGGRRMVLILRGDMDVEVEGEMR